MKLSKFYKENRTVLTLTLFLFLLISIPILIYFLTSESRDTIAWYDPGWGSRKPVLVSNDSGTELFNEDVLVVIDTAELISQGKMQSDCDDMRFVGSDNYTPLEYWVEGGCNTSATNVWVKIPYIPLAGGEAIYVYYNNALATNGEKSWAGNFFVMSTASCPTGWSRVGAYDDRFVRGNSSYGATGGSDTHSHTTSTSIGSSSSTTSIDCCSGWGSNVSANSHTHSGSTSLTANVDHKPPYLDMIFCRNSKLSLTADNILLYDTNLVTGWTRFSAMDGRFPRGAASYGGTGGLDTHTHTVSFTVNSSSDDNKIGTACTESCRYAASGNHSHSVGSTTTTGNNIPPYLDVVYMQKDTAGSLSTERPIVIFNTTSMPLGWEIFVDLDEKFPRGASSYGDTGGIGTHSHSGSRDTNNSSSTVSSMWWNMNFVAAATHKHTITWSSNSVSNLPAYIDVIFGKRKLSQDTLVGVEENPTPLPPTAQQAIAISQTEMSWAFTDNSENEEGFKVYDNLGNLMVNCPQPNISVCIESSLSPNVVYERKFTAYNSFGESDFSDLTSRYTLVGQPFIESFEYTESTASLTASSLPNIGVGSSAYFFNCLDVGCNEGINVWSTESSATVTNLGNNSNYGFWVKARNGDAVETDFSAIQYVWTLAAVPSTYVTDFSDTSVTLAISGVNNLTSGSSGSFFDCTSTNCSEGINEWVVGDTDTVTGLLPNTEYGFRAKARNYNAIETEYSTVSSLFTKASIPNLLPIEERTESSLKIVLEAENPSNTTYALRENNTGKFVNGLGELVEGEQWLTHAQLGGESGVWVTGLESNSGYSFSAKSRNQEDVEGEYSNTVSSYTLLSAVAPFDVERGVEDLTWEISTGQTGYDGIRIYDAENNLVQVCTQADVKVCQESGLTPNTEYVRKFTVFNIYGESDYSSSISTYTLAEQVSISNFSNTASSSLSLQLNMFNNPSGTNVEIYEESTSTYLDLETGVLVPYEPAPYMYDPNAVVVSNLLPNREYLFKVKAIDALGVSTEWSGIESVWTLAQIPTISSIQATSTSQGLLSISIGENPSGTKVSVVEEVTGKYLDINTGTLTSATQIFEYSQPNISVNNLEANGKYDFKIRAYNGVDVTTEWSQVSSLVTLVENPVPVVSNVGSSSVTISVSNLPNASVGQSGLLVNGYTEWRSGSSVSVTGLLPNTPYVFTIKSRNQQSVESTEVNTQNVLTLPNIPVVTSVRKSTADTVRVMFELNGNPANTELALRDRVTNQYVNTNGVLQNQPVWRTYSQWGGLNGVLVTGIESVRQLGFDVKARNSNGVESSFSNAIYVGTGSVITNVPSGTTVRLRDDSNVDVTSQAQLGERDVRVIKGGYILVDVPVSFANERNWSGVVLESDPVKSKGVAKFTSEHGVTSPYTMYVVANDTTAFRLCPSATKLSEVTEDCSNGVRFDGEFPQEKQINGTKVIVSKASIGDVVYWIADGLTGTGGMGFVVSEVREEGSRPVREIVTEVVESSSELVKTPSFIQNAVDFSSRVITNTSEVIASTPIGDLNEKEFSDVLAVTTTSTVALGVATTGLTQAMYVIVHFFNGLFSALGFRRKREPFGYVYDSRTKEPLKTAVVRILRGKRLVDTSVTDVFGVFHSNLEKGEYVIDIKKGGYVFPSQLIKGSEDYPLKNIYTGGVFRKGEEKDVSVSIPLDPKDIDEFGSSLVILRSIFSLLFAIFNIFLFGFGILLLIYTVNMRPEVFRWYIPLLYVPAFFFLVTSLFGNKFKTGKLVDSRGKPLAGKELYLIEKEFDRVVDSRVTDENGNFRFICKKGEYYIRMGEKLVVDVFRVKKNGYIFAKRVVVK